MIITRTYKFSLLLCCFSPCIVFPSLEETYVTRSWHLGLLPVVPCRHDLMRIWTRYRGKIWLELSETVIPTYPASEKGTRQSLRECRLMGGRTEGMSKLGGERERREDGARCGVLQVAACWSRGFLFVASFQFLRFLLLLKKKNSNESRRVALFCGLLGNGLHVWVSPV